MKYATHTLLIFSLGIVVLYFSPFSTVSLDAGSKATELLDFFSGKSGRLETRVRELEMENENLKAEILKERLLPERTIKVYSTHPSNNVREIAISFGLKDGAKEGLAVTYGKNLFVGRIEKVYVDYSVVRTIFDHNMEIAVRVGLGEADALLRGGNTPTLSYISSKAEITVGDPVFTASVGYPYGLKIGAIKEIKEALGNPMKEATIDPPFEFADLRNVAVRI